MKSRTLSDRPAPDIARITAVSLALVLGLVAQAPPASAQDNDNIYYSAANCFPDDANGFHGSGALGLRWSFSEGGWYNYDDDQGEMLVCPIPYYRYASDPSLVRVRIVVEDNHNASNGVVWAKLCRQSALGDPDCQGTFVSTSIPYIGTDVLSTSIMPLASTRWLWLQVHIPDVDSQDGRSGMKGYRVQQ